MSERRRIFSSVAAATVALAVALGVGPVATERIVAAYILVLTAIAAAALTRAAVSAAGPQPVSELERALGPRREERGRPPELVRVEREITLGSANAGHLHVRLLPVLRDAAAARLAARHGIDLERRPEGARRLLGEDVWELVRPDRPEPADRGAPGLGLARLRHTIDTLEAL